MLIHESKESTCELEGDVLVADILNTQFVKESKQEHAITFNRR